MTAVEEALLNLVHALAERDQERQDQLDRIERHLAAQTATKAFYTVKEAARIIRKRPEEIEKMLTDGRLWLLEGLDSSTRVIPQAALDTLQQRPTTVPHLTAVGQ